MVNELRNCNCGSASGSWYNSVTFDFTLWAAESESSELGVIAPRGARQNTWYWCNISLKESKLCDS